MKTAATSELGERLTGGHPSTMAPTLAQWDSPYVVTLNNVPKVEDMVNIGFGWLASRVVTSGGGLWVKWGAESTEMESEIEEKIDFLIFPDPVTTRSTKKIYVDQCNVLYLYNTVKSKLPKKKQSTKDGIKARQSLNWFGLLLPVIITARNSATGAHPLTRTWIGVLWWWLERKMGRRSRRGWTPPVHRRGGGEVGCGTKVGVVGTVVEDGQWWARRG